MAADTWLNVLRKEKVKYIQLKLIMTQSKIAFKILSAMIFLMFSSSCNKNIEENVSHNDNCLLNEYISTYEEDETSDMFSAKGEFDFEVEVNKLKQLLGEATLNTNISIEKKDIEKAKRILNYDKDAVFRYNTMVSDICMKQKIIRDSTISEFIRVETEKDLYERVKNFWEYVNNIANVNTTNSTSLNSKSVDTPNIPSKPSPEIISVQLDRKMLGLDKFEASDNSVKLLSTSTINNPRFSFLPRKPFQQVKITIITNSGNECEITVSSIAELKNVNRYVPKCNV